MSKLRILLNGVNAKSAGGFNVVNNIVRSLPTISPELEYHIILPAQSGYDEIRTEKNKKVHFIHNNVGHNLHRFIDIYYRIKKWCNELKPDICFTLGDIGPIKLDIPHMVLLHQAILVYKDEDYESFWKLKDRLKYKYIRKTLTNKKSFTKYYKQCCTLCF